MSGSFSIYSHRSGHEARCNTHNSFQSLQHHDHYRNFDRLIFFVV